MTHLIESFRPNNEVLPERDALREALVSMIWDRYRATPRHMQKALGPSEIGHPCMRKIAYQLMDVQRCNPEYDPLPSIIGTATHTWLQSAAEHANEQLGRERWIPEKKVSPRDDVPGSCDIYDCDTQTVVDWKVPGPTRFSKYKKNIGPVYRRQVHFYGLGFENAGYPVKTVAIALLPRGGSLRDMHIWKEPYNKEYALEGLRNYHRVICLIDDLQVEANPERYQWIPKTGYDCLWCPWFNPRPQSPIQCEGENV